MLVGSQGPHVAYFYPHSFPEVKDFMTVHHDFIFLCSCICIITKTGRCILKAPGCLAGKYGRASCDKATFLRSCSASLLPWLSDPWGLQATFFKSLPQLSWLIYTIICLLNSAWCRIATSDFIFYQITFLCYQPNQKIPVQSDSLRAELQNVLLFQFLISTLR